VSRERVEQRSPARHHRRVELGRGQIDAPARAEEYPLQDVLDEECDGVMPLR